MPQWLPDPSMLGLGGAVSLMVGALIWAWRAMMSGAIVSGATLDRVVAAEQRIAGIEARRADTEAARAQVLAEQLPRMLDLLERMDVYVRSSHQLPTPATTLPAPPDGVRS